MEFSWYVLLALGGVGFAAGFVDSIAGGGGLLTMPALLSIGGGPAYSADWAKFALGTNKGQSVFGSGMALARYARSGLLDKRRIAASFVPGLVGAALGVMLADQLDSKVLRPLVVVLLAAVAVFMMVYRIPRAASENKVVHHHVKLSRKEFWLAFNIAFWIGAYDGFFGPGTGTFLILAYVFAFHDPLNAASANAKVVNFASNLASLVIWAVKGKIVWPIALVMGVGQAGGAWVGSHVTIKHGAGAVRRIVLLVSLLMVVDQGLKLWRGSGIFNF